MVEMSVSRLSGRLRPQSGCAFMLAARESLEITDPLGQQVADLAIFCAADPAEYFSAGRTLDYNQRIYLTTGDVAYSNRSQPLIRIERNDAGRHDYLLTPCSTRMFEILRNSRNHPSCHSNLTKALRRFGISADEIHATFNVFMNAEVDSSGNLAILPPSSNAGDRIILCALEDLIIGLTACASEHTNNGTCKPIDCRVISEAPDSVLSQN